MNVQNLETRELYQLLTDVAGELVQRAGGSPKRGPIFSTPCIRCQTPILLAKTEKNNVWIGLEDSPGPYIITPEGKAAWRGGADGYSFHFANPNCPGNPDNAEASGEEENGAEGSRMFAELKKAIEVRQGRKTDDGDHSETKGGETYELEPDDQ